MCEQNDQEGVWDVLELYVRLMWGKGLDGRTMQRSCPSGQNKMKPRSMEKSLEMTHILTINMDMMIEVNCKEGE